MLSQKKKIYISGIGIFLVFLTLLFGLIFPLFSSIKKDSFELFSQKEKLASLENTKESFNQIQESYPNFQSGIEKINSLFINPKEPIEFIGFLEKTAQSLNLSIQILLGGEQPKGTDWQSISFQVKITGSFSNLMKFLEKIESAPYLVEINNLNIQKLSGNEINAGLGGKTKKTAQTDIIQANFNIIVFTK